MRKLLLAVVMFAAALLGQQTRDDSTAAIDKPFRMMAREPGVCSDGEFYINTASSSTYSLRICHPDNTWVDTGLQLVRDASFVNSTAAPPAPAVSTHGTTGTTHYGYCAAYHLPSGESACSPETLITTGNATLDGTNYNIITAPTCDGGLNTTVDIFVTTAGGNIADTGWIANVACGAAYNHQGADGDPNTAGPGGDFTGPASYVSQFALGNCYPGNLANGQASKFVLSNPNQAVLWDGQFLNFFNWGGTCAAPTNSLGTQLGGIRADGYDGTTFASEDANHAASVRAFVDGSITLGNVPIGWTIDVTAGAGSTISAMQFHSTGIPQVNVVAFSGLGTCNAGAEGSFVGVNNANTATWGASITTTGTNHVLAYCDGSAWTVAAK